MLKRHLVSPSASYSSKADIRETDRFRVSFRRRVTRLKNRSTLPGTTTRKRLLESRNSNRSSKLTRRRSRTFPTKFRIGEDWSSAMGGTRRRSWISN
jgi:hypothetical protein